MRVALAAGTPRKAPCTDASKRPAPVRERQGGAARLRLGDTEIECDGNFRLYLSTDLSSPQIQAETVNRVNVIDFAVTNPGLDEQLLEDVGMASPTHEARP